MLQSSLALPTCPFPPSFIHPSFHLFASDKRLSKKHKAQTLTFSFGTLTLSSILKGDSNRSSLTLPSVHLMSSCCPLQTQAHFHISEADLSLWHTDRFVFQNKQVALGLHYSKESTKVFDCLLWRVCRKLGFELHHSGLTSSVKWHSSSSIYHSLHCTMSLHYPSSFTLSPSQSLLMGTLRSAAYICTWLISYVYI